LEKDRQRRHVILIRREYAVTIPALFATKLTRNMAATALWAAALAQASGKGSSKSANDAALGANHGPIRYSIESRKCRLRRKTRRTWRNPALSRGFSRLGRRY
jgi:hypothetical protein